MKVNNKFYKIAIAVLVIIIVIAIVLLIVGLRLKSEQTFDNYVSDTSSEHPLYKDITRDESSLINEIIDSNIDELYNLGVTADMLDDYKLTLNNGVDKIIIEYNLDEYQVYITIKHTNLNIDSVSVYSSLNQSS